MTKRTLYIYIIGLLFALSASAAKPIDEAKALYAKGEYAEAIARLETILKRTPKDGTANYYLGLAFMQTGESAKATTALERAEERGVADASRILARTALDEYRVDDAEEHLDAWEGTLRKAKKTLPEEYSAMRSHMVMLRNMLERVEKIVIIDSVTVDSADFFLHYPLSREAGRILPGDALAPNYKRPRMIYRPENGTEVIWAAPDSTGMSNLVVAGILDDGTMETPQRLEGDPGEGGDADFPFLMPDGVTLYFANNGENSLGGYDIFLTRRTADGSLLQPQNVGMPYNSPYNDYMLAIDETSGLGWWATDRNQEPGKVTIYTFIPSASRVNYDPEDPDIADRARITSIAATQEPGKDYSPLLDHAREISSLASELSSSTSGTLFAMAMGNGKTYTSLSDFTKPVARQAMEQWLERRNELFRIKGQLAALRKAYGAGDMSVSAEILRLERRIPTIRENMQRLANQVVRIETKQ